jgi:zona occludens toxin (predicted ATPase)
MILLYTGSPGSGKSTHMAKDIYYRVKYASLPVIANFDINRDMFKETSSFFYLPNEDMTPYALMDMCRTICGDKPRKEGYVKIYIDEAQIKFNSRSWRENSEWITFFTQHRKFFCDVIMVCQHHEMLDKQVRTIVEYEVNHRKVNNVGLFGKCVSLFTFGHPVFVSVTSWYGMKMRLSSEWLLGTKKFFNLFDSYKMFENREG